jgi:DUF1009 family protein
VQVAAEIVRAAEIAAETVDAADVLEAGDEGEGAVDVPEAAVVVDGTVVTAVAEAGTKLLLPRIHTDQLRWAAMRIAALFLRRQEER